MKETWRWYGPNDPVTLTDIQQAGASGIVTALHQISNGESWEVSEIMERKLEITGHNLEWSVVESIPVHEAIKQGLPERDHYIDNYCQSIRNLGQCGVKTVCYNFMPVLDWLRTDLNYRMPNGALALRFDFTDLAVFDCHILQRPDSENDYSPEQLSAADERLRMMTATDKSRLTNTIIAGLPGSEEGYTPDEIRNILAAYQRIDAAKLRNNLKCFLQAVVPVAESAGVRLAIHPDDPPYPILGLPRIVSNEADARWLLETVNSPANGLTFCTGSYGARPDNDLVRMIEQFADRIHFVHLRSTRRDDAGNFYEADHLGGDVDMYEVVKALLEEEARRKAQQRKDWQLPMRPDHGHQMLDDLGKEVNPGYSAIGRLRGLAELRGLALGIHRSVVSEQ